LNQDDGGRSRSASWAAALVCGFAFCSNVATAETAGALRVYATESTSETVPMSVAEKDQIVNTLLDRWQRAAARFGGDPASWRDTFGLQLSLLPGSTLRRLATLNPADGYQGIVEAVAQAQLANSGKNDARTKLLGQTTTDLIFVPINPCRIVDTRFGGGGIISSGAPRDFYYANPPGGTFAAQGGAATNCGLAFTGGIAPLSPKAIAATLTVVLPSAAGNIVIYPTGATPGTTSVLNYAGGAVLANTTVIVGAQGGAADFTVALNGPTHSANVIVDAIGYYYAPAATPLDCVTVTNTNSNTSYPPGASDTFGVLCTTGYQVTGGGCTFTNADGSTATDKTVFVNRTTRRFDTNTGDFTNEWNCQWTNTDPVKSFRFIARAVCCRTPGR